MHVHMFLSAKKASFLFTETDTVIVTTAFSFYSYGRILAWSRYYLFDKKTKANCGVLRGPSCSAALRVSRAFESQIEQNV